jgi:hypothetical protein
MNRVTSIMAGLLLTAVVAGNTFEAKLNAQSGPGEIFTVPFAFTADGHVVEPGTYEIRRDSSQFLISIQNVKTGEKQLFSVRPEQRRAVSSEGLLVFNRCGDRKALSEFHVQGTNFFSTTIDGGHAKTMDLESCSHPDTVTLAAR